MQIYLWNDLRDIDNIVKQVRALSYCTSKNNRLICMRVCMHVCICLEVHATILLNFSYISVLSGTGLKPDGNTNTVFTIVNTSEL